MGRRRSRSPKGRRESGRGLQPGLVPELAPELAVGGFALLCLGLLAGALVDLSGHDYGYFLPKMLDTHLFYLRNGLALQEYTAGICAGVFQFANPQSMALALPQGLSYLFGPGFAMPATFVLISALSGGGTYLCARYWGLGKMAACMSALAMAFNGFLLTRMAIGHLAFHGFGFAPAIAALLLYGTGALHEKQWLKAGMLGALAALLTAFLIYSGIGVMIINTAAVAFLLLLVCGGFQRRWLRAAAYCLFWSGLGLLATAPKIEAVLAMNANLTRDFYPLPGFAPAYSPLALLQSLFGVPGEAAMNGQLLNRQFYMGWHEFYYGFTPLLGIVLLLTVMAGWQRLQFAAALRGRPLAFGIVGLALILAFALNVYEPGWNRFIKSLPLLGQFSGMTRFYIFFMPVIALFLGWCLNHWRRIPLLGVLLFTGLLALVQHRIIDDNLRDDSRRAKGLEPTMYYDRAGLGDMLGAWAEPERVPPVSAVSLRTSRQADGSLQAVHAPQDDGKIALGESNALCYEPLFGYRLEQFRLGGLRPGAITLNDGSGNLNLKNPACYVYPEANGCAPGDHFKASQMQQMLTLADYGDPGLAVSSRRLLAERVGLPVLLGLAAYLLGSLLWWGVPLLHRRFFL